MAPVPPTPMRSPVSEIGLPSAAPDFRFVFSATVCWLPSASAADVPHRDLAALARYAVLVRAARATAAEAPDENRFVQHRLEADLGMMRPDDTASIHAWAVDVSLVLPEPDAERLRVLADVRKDEKLWEHERRYECSRRRYLSDDVLKNTGSAVVWWLARNTRDTSQVTQTVALIGALAQLSSAANNTPVPELYRSLIAGGAERDGDASFSAVPVEDSASMLVDRLFTDPDDPRRDTFSSDFATLLEKYDLADHAEQIRKRYNAPDFFDSDDNSGDPLSAPAPVDNP
jgi:hypothetical protein